MSTHLSKLWYKAVGSEEFPSHLKKKKDWFKKKTNRYIGVKLKIGYESMKRLSELEKLEKRRQIWKSSFLILS